jgi:hypothetical protein
MLRRTLAQNAVVIALRDERNNRPIVEVESPNTAIGQIQDGLKSNLV